MSNPETAELTRPFPLPLNDCGLAAASDLVGDRWKILILRELFYGVRRFGDIQEHISIPRSGLSKRLNELVAAGILKRVEYQESGQRARFEYHLTRMGTDLMVPLLALRQWAEKHVEGKTSDLVVTQPSTGLDLVVGFARDSDLIPLNDVVFETRPLSGS